MTFKPDEISIIVPDIHQDAFWLNHIVSVFSPYQFKYVFIGDYFDKHDPNPQLFDEDYKIQNFCYALNEILLSQEEHIFLCGNHDLPYLENRNSIFRGSNHACGNTSPFVSNQLKQHLHKSFWEKLTLCHNLDNILISHAGFNNHTWNQNKSINENVHILNQFFETLKSLSPIPASNITAASFTRRGDQAFGGPLWQDWSELPPSLNENTYQIMGHTKDRYIRYTDHSLCLDCIQSHIAVLIKQKIAPEQEKEAIQELSIFFNRQLHLLPYQFITPTPESDYTILCLNI